MSLHVGIETLPQELQRNFTVMRTLDQKTEDVKTEIERCSQNYRDEVSRLGDKERSRDLNNIQEMFKKAIENSDNKVQMAMQMYEMVSMVLPTLVKSGRLQPPLRIFNHHSINFTISVCIKYYRNTMIVLLLMLSGHHFYHHYASLGRTLTRVLLF